MVTAPDGPHDAGLMPIIGRRAHRGLETQLYPLSAYLGFPQRAHSKPLEHHVHFYEGPAAEQGMVVANPIRIRYVLS